jgi:hypothetical protein
MMSVDIMMSLIFRCRHHDECEHNDGRVEPYLSTKVSHTLLTVNCEPNTALMGVETDVMFPQPHARAPHRPLREISSVFPTSVHLPLYIFPCSSGKDS